MAKNERRTWWDIDSPYRYRNDNLARMGFKSYRAYLGSALWKGIKQRVLDRYQGKCVRCYKPATQVHHRAYDPATLKGDNIDSLSPVCAKCHCKAEQPKNFRRSASDRLHESSAEIHKSRKSRRRLQNLPRLVRTA